MRLSVVFAALILFVGGTARADDAGDRLASGFALLDEAARLRQAEPARAAGLAADAAVLIESAIGDGASMNPAAQRALGNAYLLADRIGPAVLAYKRAESVAPNDPLVRASLEHARSRVGLDLGVGSGGTGWRSVLNDWRGGIPRRAVFHGCVAAAVVACWVLALRVLSVLPRWVVIPAAVAVGVSACGAGLVLAEPLVAGSDDAVVTVAATGRTGPHAEVYPAALDRPVPAGAEVRILETRDGWYLCAVGGERAWLPGGSVERVRQAVQDAGG